MTEALAKSNNQYFASLGRSSALSASVTTRISSAWAKKPDWISKASKPGLLPPAPPKNGMGMMTSFGDGISLTPLELTALISAVANGGTLYYLQYPRTQEEAADDCCRASSGIWISKR